MFSSLSMEWGTPQKLFDALNVEFNFTIDVAASKENAKCFRYYTKENSGLDQSWKGERCWMNPPYGKQLYTWMEKAYNESENEKCLVVCLVPIRTDTRLFHDIIMHCAEVRFLKRPVIFQGMKRGYNAAPFNAGIIIMNGNHNTKYSGYDPKFTNLFN